MMTKLLEYVGHRVQLIRKLRSWSQAELAERCNMHRNTIGSIERGERSVEILTLARVANILGIEVTWLLSGLNLQEHTEECNEKQGEGE